MVDLTHFIVCGVCHKELPFVEIRKTGYGHCPGCARRYPCTQGIYNMIPTPVPDEALMERWPLWEKLQHNGMLSYTKAPELNLAVGKRKDAVSFGEFCGLSGFVLDVGCGPQSLPSYLPKKMGIEVVGVDPLIGEQPRKFNFIQAIGEYLPFREGVFDHVLFATSLDHMVDPKQSLHEARRCLKKGGSLNLWLNEEENNGHSHDSKLGRWPILMKKGIRTLLKGDWMGTLGWRRFFSYVKTVAGMSIPEGAADCFHLKEFDIKQLFEWMKEFDLAVVRQESLPRFNAVFIQARKQNQQMSP